MECGCFCVCWTKDQSCICCCDGWREECCVVVVLFYASFEEFKQNEVLFLF